MKESQPNTILNVLALVSALALATVPGHAQLTPQQGQMSDSVVAIVADAQDLPFVPPDQRPLFGTFWEVRSSLPCHPAPAPCPPFDPSIPVYLIGRDHYLVDETAGQILTPESQYLRGLPADATTASILQAQVDELQNFVAQVRTRLATAALAPREQMNALTLDGPSGGGPLGPTPMDYTAEDLWLQLITLTNTTGLFVVHPPAAEATTGVYDLFMTTNLSPGVPGLNLTNWAWLLRTGPGESNLLVPDLTADTAYFMLAKTNDADADGMTDAYEHLVSHTDPNHPDAPIILVQPFGQTVDQGDTVTFSVVAEGAPPLGYQWLLGGTAVSGETNKSLTFLSADPSQQGDYSVQVTSPVGLSTVSSNATLTVQSPANWPLVTLTGARQNYTFKNGVSYYVASRVEFHGTTTIEGGATIKADWYYPDSTLAVMGTLVCKTDDPYFPAFLTSIDDDTVGDALSYSSGDPATASNGAAYLDLTYAQDAQPALNNLRIRYADQAIATPPQKRLDVWNCEFLECNSGIVANRDAIAALHNVLFGACGAAVAGSTNFTAIEAEHLTSDATNLWTQLPPGRISLTNSVIVGTIATGPTLVTDHTAINAAAPVFQQAGSGHYYLTNTSPYRRAGTAHISPRLATEFSQKSTQPPVVFPEMIPIAGELTLGPQVTRYTNGPPDYGFYYPALDYTVGWITNRGSITILPGTAIGFRNEYSTNHNRWTWWGFDLREGSSFTSRGTPNKPIVFVDVQLVQEQLTDPCAASFVPDFWPGGGPNLNAAPLLDFRFCRFYANSRWYHVWSGYDASYNHLYSPDSRVDWKMQDCSLYGGRITLGEPDDGSWYGAPPDWVYGDCAVSWRNNLFDNVSIDIDPTLYEYGLDDLGLNCDMAFEAFNNLFRSGLWLHLEPIPASAGIWTFRDNLFDKTDFIQDTNAPLDFNYNGYWPLGSSEVSWLYNYYPWLQPNGGQLLLTTNGGGGNEQVLDAAPPYQTGPLGNYYLPATTPLYHAGSRTAGDAGMHQYTTRADQIKEGDESPSGHNVSIGLHYVATTNTNSKLPKDSDGDGIPDYIEDGNGNGIVDYNETDPNNPATDGVTPDAYSSAYDGVDLSGNGLTSLLKKALGLSPLDPNNPLTLTKVITGDEPVTTTFEVPVSYDAVTAAGFFHLNLDGFGATGEQLTRATNGHCLLKFNQYFDPPGQHYLSANFRMGGQAADGRLLPFLSTNELQFEPSGAMFDDSGAYLDAKIFVDQTDYVINLYDTSTTNEAFMLSITNTAYNGMIQQDWGVTNTDGSPFTGTSVRAEFLLTSAAPAGGKGPSKPIQRVDTNTASEWGLNFNFAYMYTPTNRGLSSAFAKGGDLWNGMQGVVDLLIAPRYGWDHYNSDFNRYVPPMGSEYPGYLASQATVTNNLYPTLPGARQFYCYAHGSSNYMANYVVDTHISAGEIGGILHNSRSNIVIIANNPYRFVFLDGCSTGATLDWQTAFGVAERSEVTRSHTGAQAFVAWASDHAGWMNGSSGANTDLLVAKAFTKTLQYFYTDWMTGVPLAQCIDHASLPLNDTVPFPVPQNKFTLINFSNGDYYTDTNVMTSRIYIVGHPGLTVDRVNPREDTRTDYAR
jgi:hypothetical protein